MSAKRSRPSQRRSELTVAQRRSITRLQKNIRNAINLNSQYGYKIGVEPNRLRWALRTCHVDLSGITIRQHRPPAGSDLWADCALYEDGQLLFRLKLVPWEDGADARWHVKRHPDATWWRSSRQRTSNTLRRARSGPKR